MLENHPQLKFPEVHTVVRDNGDSVVELRQNGLVVGELNFTQLFTGWLQAFGMMKKPRHLTSVP